MPYSPGLEPMCGDMTVPAALKPAGSFDAVPHVLEVKALKVSNIFVPGQLPEGPLAVTSVSTGLTLVCAITNLTAHSFPNGSGTLLGTTKAVALADQHSRRTDSLCLVPA